MNFHRKGCRKISIVLFTMVLISAIFFGCGTEQIDTKGGADTIVCVDSVGREVEVPRNPKTIAALDSFAGQAVFILGEGDKLIATVGGVQRDKLLQEISPSLTNAAVPSGGGTINAEELLSLKPDITFVKGSLYAVESERAKLDALGLAYLVIDYKDMDEQMEAIDIMGKALGKTETAEGYKAYYNAAIQLVRDRVKDIPKNELPRIYHSVNEAVRTDGPDTLSTQWITITRAVNVSVDKPLNYSDDNYYATLEQIYEWNPEIIICNESGVADYILSDPKWEGLDAVTNKTVYQIPIGASRWGHPGSAETPLALLWLAKTLYPDRFSDLDIEEKTKEFYGEFFHYFITPEIMEQILSGKDLREASQNSSAN